MEMITNFIDNINTNNIYIWVIVILLIIVIALIGFFVDRANKRRNSSQMANKKEMGKESVPVVDPSFILHNQSNETVGEINNMERVEPMTELGNAVESNIETVYSAPESLPIENVTDASTTIVDEKQNQFANIEPQIQMMPIEVPKPIEESTININVEEKNKDDEIEILS